MSENSEVIKLLKYLAHQYLKKYKRRYGDLE